MINSNGQNVSAKHSLRMASSKGSEHFSEARLRMVASTFIYKNKLSVKIYKFILYLRYQFTFQHGH
jgi:hypothetical protein